MHIHFDCFSGISGDMTLGAFIDAGVSLERLKADIENLPLTGFDITAAPVMRNGITATNVFVHADDHVHPKNYAQIKALIGSSNLSDRVKKLSLDIFEKIACAESKIHNCPPDKVHFHEVGGIDAIVDIVGAALCVEYLDVKTVSSSAIPLGNGFVQCAHGILPVPAPATVEILKGVPVAASDIECELVTPTGAAIIRTLCDSFGAMPPMKIENIGYGSGKKDLGNTPNLLRIFSGTVGGADNFVSSDSVVAIECCIDDMNPEIFGYVMDILMENGALDICLIPAFMKKNRPGTKLEVLCRPDDLFKISGTILNETSTLGVRYHETRRLILDRELVTVETRFGKLQAKRVTGPDSKDRIIPEYDVCKKIALESKLPMKDIYAAIASDASVLE